MTNVLFRPHWHFSRTKNVFTLFLGLPASCLAEHPALVSESLDPYLMLAVVIVLFSIMVLALCILRQQRCRMKKQYARLSANHEALREQKYLWHSQEAALVQQNQQLEQRLNARTETVNKINHELTRALEKLQHNQLLNASFKDVLNNNEALVLIIDKHYCVRFCSQSFLDYTGLPLADVEHKALRQLEKHICLPEMVRETFVLNRQGWLDTQLKCRDRENTMHILNARIKLTWSEQKDIAHYVIVIERKDLMPPPKTL